MCLGFASDGFSSLICSSAVTHTNKRNTHACMAYIHISMHIWATAPFVFVLCDSSNDDNNKNKTKANILLSMSCIGWTQSSHKALRGGSHIALSLNGPVVSSLQIIVPCLPERIWLGAQSPSPPPSVITSFHRCLVTVVRDNGNVS